MASKIKAISAERPRIDSGALANERSVADYFSGRSTVTLGLLVMVLLDLAEALQYFALQGRTVKLPGLGIFKPSLNVDGKININFIADKILIQKLNDDMGIRFSGKIVNRQNIGKTSDELVAAWNKKHPDDQVC